MSTWVIRHPLLATFLPLALFVLSGGMLVAWQAHRASVLSDGLDDFGPVGSFAFTDKDGRAVRDTDLNGKVWIAACFFTCCPESCPQLSAALARLQGELANEPDVRLVSLTVDPTTDTPQKLNQYAEGYEAIADRWLFLRPDERTVHDFVTQQLRLGVDRNREPDVTAINRMIHSNKLTHIDRRGHIRG